jgi:hypothetical protein
VSLNSRRVASSSLCLAIASHPDSWSCVCAPSYGIDRVSTLCSAPHHINRTFDLFGSLYTCLVSLTHSVVLGLEWRACWHSCKQYDGDRFLLVSFGFGLPPSLSPHGDLCHAQKPRQKDNTANGTGEDRRRETSVTSHPPRDQLLTTCLDPAVFVAGVRMRRTRCPEMHRFLERKRRHPHLNHRPPFLPFSFSVVGPQESKRCFHTRDHHCLPPWPVTHA